MRHSPIKNGNVKSFFAMDAPRSLSDFYDHLLLLLICLHYLAAYGRQVRSDLFGKLHDVHKLLLHCAHA